jgi:TRAP-type C4-dicarboxylate transport system substrate-binding protein
MTKVILGVTAAVLGLLPFSASCEPVKLKLAFFGTDTEMTYVSVIKPFAEMVNKEGKGIVEIDLFPNGALGRSVPQQSQMVLDGVADIAFIIPGTSPGRFSDTSVVELPGILNTFHACSLGLTRLVATGKLNDFKDYFVIGAASADPNSFQSHLKLTSFADIKGKKFRVSGQVLAEATKQLGGVPVLIPINEAAEAIGRGTVDGAVTPYGSGSDWGIFRVTSYHYQLAVGCSDNLLLMNKKVFDALPKAGQDIIRKYSGEWYVSTYEKGYGEYLSGLINGYKADPKRTVTTPTAAEVKMAKDAFQPVVDAWGAKSPHNAELLKEIAAVAARIAAESPGDK